MRRLGNAEVREIWSRKPRDRLPGHHESFYIFSRHKSARGTKDCALWKSRRSDMSVRRKPTVFSTFDIQFCRHLFRKPSAFYGAAWFFLHWVDDSRSTFGLVVGIRFKDNDTNFIIDGSTSAVPQANLTTYVSDELTFLTHFCCAGNTPKGQWLWHQLMWDCDLPKGHNESHESLNG